MIWRAIDGFPLYEVSDSGLVRNSRTGRILSQEITYAGYARVILMPTRKKYAVHRLVAKAFVDGYKPELQVNHKDENKLNNYADNLEWCTAKENTNYGTARTRTVATRKAISGYTKAVKSMQKANWKPVCAYDEDGNLVATYSSATEAGRKLGVDRSNISACLNGKLSKSNGFIWRFAL